MADPQQLQQLLNQLNQQFSLLEDKLNNIGSLLSDKITNRISDLKDEARDFTERFAQGEDVAKKVGAKLLTLQKDLNKLSLNRIKLENDLARVQATGNVQAEARIKKAISQNALATKLLEELQTQLVTLQNTATEEKKITEEKKKQIGLSSILDKLGLSNLMTFKAILDAAFKIDNQVTGLSKSLNISKESAGKLREDFYDYALASEDAFLNVDRMYKAQMGLTEQLGIAVKFGNEEVEQFARLTEQVGLSSEEAGKLAQFSAATGTSTKDYVASLRNGAFEAMRTNKIHVSDKEILSTIGKLSAGILVKFQKNPEALAKAVVQAKALGLNLEQVNKIGDQMLDWESSIEKELEAELITGKQLNFERARAAALTGDQATLMQEIANQAGSLAEFSNMNVVAQNSLAQAFGMNRDEMADMLMKQEAINKYGDKAGELNKEQLEYMEKHNLTADQMTDKIEKQRSTQEMFNDAMLRMQDIVGQLLSEESGFGKLLNFIATILQNTTALSILLGIIAAKQISSLINGFAQTAKILKSVAKFSIAEAVAKVVTSAASVPMVGWVLAAGAGAAIGAMLHSYLADDLMSPGYGKRVLTTPEGTFKLNDNDTVLAGTDLGGGRRDSNAGVIAAIANLTNTVATNKSAVGGGGNGNIYLDGERVGTMVGRRNETGTEQVKNSYRLA